MALIDKLTAIADAIRGKTGKTDEMTLDQMAVEIASIETNSAGSSGALVIGNVNLHNPDTDVPNTYVSDTDGQLVTYDGYSSTDYIKVKPGKIYALFGAGHFGMHNSAHYDGEKKYIAQAGYGQGCPVGENVFTFIRAVGEYVRFSMYQDFISSFLFYECGGDIVNTNNISFTKFEHDDEPTEIDYQNALAEMGVEV